jgi:ABC-type nitrate/sulfonate/bicarbonate transport system substrate-binding protein
MKRMVKRIASAVAGFALLTLAASVKAEPLEIRMAYGGVPGIISPLLFLKPELLKHYGKSYTVKSTYIAATSTALQGIASGDFDLSYMSFTALASAIQSGGVDMKVISDITSWGGYGYEGPQAIVLSDSGINKIQDLKGKILAVTAKGTGFHYALLAQLKEAGLRPNDYTIVEVGRGAMGAALREHRVDLAYESAPFLFSSERKGGVKRLFKPEDVMGIVQAVVMVGSAGFLKRYPAPVTDFLEDYIIGLRWFLDPNNHEEAVRLTAEFTKLPPSMFEDFAFTKKDFYRSPTATPDINALQRNINLMQELGIIKRKLDLQPYVDLTYLDEAKKRLGIQ